MSRWRSVFGAVAGLCVSLAGFSGPPCVNIERYSLPSDMRLVRWTVHDGILCDVDPLGRTPYVIRKVDLDHPERTESIAVVLPGGERPRKALANGDDMFLVATTSLFRVSRNGHLDRVAVFPEILDDGVVGKDGIYIVSWRHVWVWEEGHGLREVFAVGEGEAISMYAISKDEEWLLCRVTDVGKGPSATRSRLLRKRIAGGDEEEIRPGVGIWALLGYDPGGGFVVDGKYSGSCKDWKARVRVIGVQGQVTCEVELPFTAVYVGVGEAWLLGVGDEAGRVLRVRWGDGD